MLKKLQYLKKGSIMAFAVLGVVAIVSTIVKMRRARAILAEAGETADQCEGAEQSEAEARQGTAD